MPQEPTLQIPIVFPKDNVSFDPDAFDQQALEKGVTLRHFASISCAGGPVDTGDVRSAHIDCGCDNGRLYRFAGLFDGIFTGYNKNEVFNLPGVVDHSSAYIIVPRFYKDTQTQMYFAPYDRIEINCKQGEEIYLVYWERNSISQTGVDRLTYPVCKVQYLIDSAGKEYKQDVDFQLKNGNIVWTGQNRPLWNQTEQLGQAYTIRYFIKGSYIVNNVLHEMRMVKTFDPFSNESVQVRYPNYLLVQKEINFWANKKDKIIPNLAEHLQY